MGEAETVETKLSHGEAPAAGQAAVAALEINSACKSNLSKPGAVLVVAVTVQLPVEAAKDSCHCSVKPVESLVTVAELGTRAVLGPPLTAVVLAASAKAIIIFSS